jgi:S-adenosyl-L-methionine hydrolase (adenosine-forming)
MRRRPVITLTTDFGYTDAYVAEMKGVLLGEVPDAQLVDVTHAIGPQDVTGGSIVLERVLRAFPRGTIHIVVVDPGVGSERWIGYFQIAGQHVICPDNGLITWAWRRIGGGKAFEVTWRPGESSRTFHGRDVMAPIAARLAKAPAGRGWCRAMPDPIFLDLHPARAPDEVRVIYVDHFGNAVTNWVGAGARHVRVKKRRVAVHQTYADVAVGAPVALVGSSGLLEIAVRDGSAAGALRIRVGDVVRID